MKYKFRFLPSATLRYIYALLLFWAKTQLGLKPTWYDESINIANVAQRRMDNVGRWHGRTGVIRVTCDDDELVSFIYAITTKRFLQQKLLDLPLNRMIYF